MPQVIVFPEAEPPAATPHGPADMLPGVLWPLHQATIPNAPMPKAPIAISLRSGSRCFVGNESAFRITGRRSNGEKPDKRHGQRIAEAISERSGDGKTIIARLQRTVGNAQ